MAQITAQEGDLGSGLIVGPAPVLQPGFASPSAPPTAEGQDLVTLDSQCLDEALPQKTRGTRNKDCGGLLTHCNG